MREKPWLKIIQSHTGLVLGSVVQQAVAAHISELAGGLLVLDLRYRGNMETLADHLDRQPLGKGYLMIKDVAMDRLDMASMVL